MTVNVTCSEMETIFVFLIFRQRQDETNMREKKCAHLYFYFISPLSYANLLIPISFLFQIKLELHQYTPLKVGKNSQTNSDKLRMRLEFPSHERFSPNSDGMLILSSWELIRDLVNSVFRAKWIWSTWPYAMFLSLSWQLIRQHK